MRKKFFLTIAILGALAAITPMAQAAPGDQGPAYQMQPYGQTVTPEQWAKAQQIFNESYGEMEQTRQALAAKRMELDQLLGLPAPDKGRIESLSREIGELRGKMLSSRVETRNRLAQQGLPPDCFGMMQNYMYGNWNGGPCWYGYGPMGWDNGWRHHGHRGHGGPRGGCW